MTTNYCNLCKVFIGKARNFIADYKKITSPAVRVKKSLECGVFLRTITSHHNMLYAVKNNNEQTYIIIQKNYEDLAFKITLHYFKFLKNNDVPCIGYIQNTCLREKMRSKELTNKVVSFVLSNESYKHLFDGNKHLFDDLTEEEVEKIYDLTISYICGSRQVLSYLASYYQNIINLINKGV